MVYRHPDAKNHSSLPFHFDSTLNWRKGIRIVQEEIFYDCQLNAPLLSITHHWLVFPVFVSLTVYVGTCQFSSTLKLLQAWWGPGPCVSTDCAWHFPSKACSVVLKLWRYTVNTVLRSSLAIVFLRISPSVLTSFSWVQDSSAVRSCAWLLFSVPPNPENCFVFLDLLASWGVWPSQFEFVHCVLCWRSGFYCVLGCTCSEELLLGFQY